MESGDFNKTSGVSKRRTFYEKGKTNRKKKFRDRRLKVNH